MTCSRCGTAVPDGVPCPVCGPNETASPAHSGGALAPSAGAASWANGTPAAPAPAPLVPARGYTVEAVIGEGGMGIVYRARAAGSDRPVAIKRLRALDEAGERAIARFWREAQVVGSLQHENIATIHEFSEDESGPFIVMEYVAAGDLGGVVERRGPIPEAEALVLFRGICLGVAHAHEHGVIHRDIKPANVLVADDGTPKVVDFGLARAASDALISHSLSLRGQVLGTLAYMAPEQRRDAHAADARSDIYALGKTLYHLLTGELPETVDLEAVPQASAAVLRKALKQRPEERYATVADLIEAVDAAAGGAHRCPRCGTMAGEDARFCPSCRWVLAPRCPTCGRDVDRNDTFCPRCGADIRAGWEAQEAQDDGTRAFRERRYADAVAALSRSLEMRPQSPAAQRLLEQARDILFAQQRVEAARRSGDPSSLLTALSDFQELAPSVDVGREVDDAARRMRRRERWRRWKARLGKFVVACLVLGCIVSGILSNRRDERRPPRPAHAPRARAAPRAPPPVVELEPLPAETLGPQVSVRGTIGEAGCSVEVNGASVPVQGLRFEATVPILECANAVTVVTTRAGGASSRISALVLRPDLAPPPSPREGPATGWSGEPLPERMMRGPVQGLYLWDARAVGIGLIEMVYVPPGDFVMGAPEGGPSDATPAHTHPIPHGFYIGRREVRRDEFLDFCRISGWPPPADPPWGRSALRPGHPAGGVSWIDARSFAAAAGLRLPTEAEWEMAARGPYGRTYPWGNQWEDARANVRTIFRPATGTVTAGSMGIGASFWGCLDMAGNVWEWCEDWYDPAAYARYRDGDLAPPPTGERRVLRGGSCGDIESEVASYVRYSDVPSRRCDYYGFRVVADAPTP